MNSDFINCPFCSGHEAISQEAAVVILEAFEPYLKKFSEGPLKCELENIRNMILNAQERKQPAERYTPPICPTPGKRPYSNREHALPDAVKWHQHAYECPCGYWHLSKQSGAEHHAKINSPAAGSEEFESIDPLLL